FIGKVGQDHFGRFLTGVLESEGVDTRGIRFDEEARTTMAVIAMPDEFSAEFVFYRNPGADQRLRQDELETALLEGTRVLHVGSLSLTDEPSRGATFEAVKIARGAGAVISYDVNYRPSLWKDPDEALEMVAAILPRADLVKVNEVEAALLGGTDQISPQDLPVLETAAGSIIDKGPSLVLVTFGERGSYFHTAEGGRFVPPFRVRSIDSVGCGDAFTAGLLVKLLEGDGWPKNLAHSRLFNIVRFANAVGAIVSLHRGVIPALPTASRVEEFLARYEEPG
ncbi:MAG: carbohydrate kinase, partial [Anaerolineales bacterium]|nr:carbohydrate kinase [Anaerolineales bacterium]